jgi:prolipoprotein diacylglyceryl transferase
MPTAPAALVASIPSPGSGTIEIGPVNLNAYGLMIALGVVAAVWLAGRRFEQLGIGTRDDASAIALWAVPAGVIGARIYHVVTDWQLFEDDPGRIIEIWKGGLGIWGGIALGVPVGVFVARRRGLPMGWALTAVTPALPLAQAIGRWGNWFNQELYGRPTDLPWGLEISDPPALYPPGTLFHPTFLYESLGNLVLCVALIWLGNRVVRRPARLFAWYVAGYTAMRFFIEGLRIDPANDLGGLRVNEVVSIVMFTLAVVVIVVDHLRHRGEPDPVIPQRVGAPADTVGADDDGAPGDGVAADDGGRDDDRRQPGDDG